MNKEITKTKLKDLIDFKNGKIAPKENGAYPIYGGNGILGFTNVWNYENVLIIGRVGAYCGNVHIEVGKCWVNDNAIAGIHKQIESSEYNYYLLKSISLNKKQIGSSQPLITQGVLNEIDINVIKNIYYRKKISSVFANIDSKINLNNQINSELEAIAKTIYDYWFVQFDFPDENGKPYKSSGGEMVWSEELKKEIPKDWEVKKLGDLMNSKRKKYDLKSNNKTDTIDLSIMPSGTFSLNLKNSSENFKTNLFELEKFDLLFGSIRPYLLKAGFSPFKGAVNGSVLSFKPFEEYCFNFLLLTLTNKNMFEFAVSNSRGTRMPVVRYEDILNYKVAFDKNTVVKFGNLQLKEIISNNINQNFELSELRDFLLPLLMNGQVTIND